MAGFVVKSIGRELEIAFKGLQQPMARAATAAMRQCADIAKSKGRSSIANAGFSTKWQNALRAKVYPEHGDSLKPAAWIFHKIAYADVFEDGAVIDGQPYLWLPTDFVPISSRRKSHPMTPAEYSARYGPLVAIHPPGRPPMLIAKYKPVGQRRGKARKAGDTRVPLFIGIPAVDIDQKFGVRDAVREAAEQLPALYAANLKAG